MLHHSDSSYHMPGTGYSLELSNNNTGNIQTLSLTDIAFGDVWLCSGQSNMVFVLKVRARSH